MSGLGLHMPTGGTAHTGIRVPSRGERPPLPTPLRAARVLLHVLFALTCVGGFGVIAGAVTGGVMSAGLVGIALYAALPGVVSWLLAWRVPRRGRRVWGGLAALQIWLIVSSLLNLAAGSYLGLSQLLLPVMILTFLSRPESRQWFGVPAGRGTS
ncbi:hypothetical protein DVH02_13585, partial [Streptomyces corynorhini]